MAMKDQRFTFLCSREERALITELARRLERSEGDTMRVALRELSKRMESRRTDQILEADWLADG